MITVKARKNRRGGQGFHEPTIDILPSDARRPPEKAHVRACGAGEFCAFPGKRPRCSNGSKISPKATKTLPAPIAFRCLNCYNYKIVYLCILCTNTKKTRANHFPMFHVEQSVWNTKLELNISLFYKEGSLCIKKNQLILP